MSVSNRTTSSICRDDLRLLRLFVRIELRPAQNRSVSQVLVVLLVITPLLAVWRAWRWTVEKAGSRLSVTVPPDDERMLPKG
jgi:hypothetical protein